MVFEGMHITRRVSCQTFKLSLAVSGGSYSRFDLVNKLQQNVQYCQISFLSVSSAEEDCQLLPHQDVAKELKLVGLVVFCLSQGQSPVAAISNKLELKTKEW